MPTVCFVRGGWVLQTDHEWLIWSDLIFQTRWSGIVGTFRSGCYGRSISTGFRRWERPSKIWMGKIYVPWARKTSDSVRHSAVKRYTHIWIYGNQVKYSDQYACTKSTMKYCMQRTVWIQGYENSECENSLPFDSSMWIWIKLSPQEVELEFEWQEVNLSTL